MKIKFNSLINFSNITGSFNGAHNIIYLKIFNLRTGLIFKNLN